VTSKNCRQDNNNLNDSVGNNSEEFHKFYSRQLSCTPEFYFFLNFNSKVRTVDVDVELSVEIG